MASIRLENTDELPICPHCESQFDHLNRRVIGESEIHAIYFCPNCKKVMDVTSEKYGY